MREEFRIDLKRMRTCYVWRDKQRLKNEPPLRQFLVLAHQIKKALEKDPKRSLKELSGWLGFSQARLGQILNLLYLSPSIQRCILLTEDKSLYDIPEYKAREIMKELDWEKQEKMWRELHRTQR